MNSFHYQQKPFVTYNKFQKVPQNMKPKFYDFNKESRLKQCSNEDGKENTESRALLVSFVTFNLFLNYAFIFIF